MKERDKWKIEGAGVGEGRKEGREGGREGEKEGGREEGGKGSKPTTQEGGIEK